MNIQTHTLLVGIVLGVTGAAMLAYALLRPQSRRNPVLFGATANLLGAIFWCVSAGAVHAPERMQIMLGSLRALPFDAAVGYLCYLIVRSVGKKHPRVEPVINTGTYLLPACPLMVGILCAALFPHPALQSNALGGTEVLVPRLRNVVEAFFLSLITLVFLREALERSSPLLRLQNACLSVAGGALLLALGANLAIAIERAFGTQRSVLTSLLDSSHTILLSGVSMAGVCYVAGIVLYHSAEEREALLERYRAWIKRRFEIEAAFENIFGTGLGNSDSGAKVAAYFHRAANSLKLSKRHREQGRLTIGLFALMLDARYRHLVSELRATQQELLHAREFPSCVLAGIGGKIRYDIRDDALYSALDAALHINSDSGVPPGKQTGDPSPPWAQLAAALAADAGFLPEPQRTDVLSATSYGASPAVLDAYRRAKLAENRLASGHSNRSHRGITS